MAEADKECGDDLIVNERTQTNVCTAQRSPSIEKNVSDDIRGGERRKEDDQEEEWGKANT
jgi:hypothetical protein